MNTPTLIRSKAFTVLELLVVVIIVAILAAIALPKFVEVQTKSRNAIVKVNMHTVQITAEAFARDHGGSFPASPPVGGDAWSSYFPGGNADMANPKAGIAPRNPFTSKSLWSDIVPLKLKSANVEAERLLSPAQSSIVGYTVGQVGYIGIADAEGKITSYAIEGVDGNGAAVAGSTPNTTLVLSNQQ